MNFSKIVGIVNITTDSFSDGGAYVEYEKALQHSLELVESGADIIDLGAASSNPQTTPVSTAEEIERLKPLISALKEKKIQISVDTFNPDVQRFCLQENVSYINDIQGFPYPEIYADLAKNNCNLIVMHSIQRMGAATIVETDPIAVFDSMLSFFSERIKDLTNAGIAEERIIIDPGMGYFLGSNPDTSIYVLKNIDKLKKTFGLPVLIGVSRKSFLGSITGSDIQHRGSATLAAELYASLQGVDYIRTHDVRAIKDALTIWQKLF
jgi:dihydropteroate synthase type 2/dihydropteroate synthase type 3